MFAGLIERAERLALRRARERSAALAEEIAAMAPPGVAVAADEQGVSLSGRALRRRFALDPALRWLVAGLTR